MRGFQQQRLMSVVLLGCLLVPLMAPLAEAGHSRRRYRVVRTVECAPRVTYYQRSSSAGPMLAGLLGGLVIGAAVAHAAPAQVSVSTGYWDPYCDRGFASLDVYYSHCARHHHSR